MKKLLSIMTLIILLVTFVGCSKVQIKAEDAIVKQHTAKEVSQKLKDSNLPIDTVIAYTEDTDRNKLLGRPNQYISKVNFADSRLEQDNLDRPKGGSIEVFKNSEDLKTRKEYIESATKSMPTLTQYMIVNDKYLLRLDKDLTPTQVEEYRKVFMKIK